MVTLFFIRKHELGPIYTRCMTLVEYKVNIQLCTRWWVSSVKLDFSSMSVVCDHMLVLYLH